MYVQNRIFFPGGKQVRREKQARAFEEAEIDSTGKVSVG